MPPAVARQNMESCAESLFPKRYSRVGDPDACQIESVSGTDDCLETPVGLFMLLQDQCGWTGLQHDELRRSLDLEGRRRLDFLNRHALQQAVSERLLPVDPLQRAPQ